MAQVFLGLELPNFNLCLHLHTASPLLMSSPFLSLLRTLVIGFRSHLCNPGGHYLEILDSTTSTKMPFPNKTTFTSSEDKDVDIMQYMDIM